MKTESGRVLDENWRMKKDIGRVKEKMEVWKKKWVKRESERGKKGMEEWKWKRERRWMERKSGKSKMEEVSKNTKEWRAKYDLKEWLHWAGLQSKFSLT